MPLDLQWVETLRRESSIYDQFVQTLDDLIAQYQSEQDAAKTWEAAQRALGKKDAIRGLKHAIELDEKEAQHVAAYRRETTIRPVR